MIVEHKPRTFEQSDAEATSYNFGIDEEDMGVIAGFLEDKIYTDKVLAVVREYSTNCVDAHVEAGYPEKPFLVQLPTDFEPNFKVRDYGLGLSEEKLRTIFTRYGKSTKRNTNTQTGSFGLGCKSGFAYANSFMVTSICGGRKFVYNAAKDTNSLNKLIKIHEEESTEPTGVEICIPVAQKDFHIFKHRALNLYRWFKVKPEIHGITDFEKENLSPERTILLQGNSWTLYNTGDARAIMGNIGYKVEAHAVKDATEEERILLNSALEMEFEIGDLEIIISREGLEYSEKTSGALRKRLGEVQAAVQELIQKRFDDCATMWDAKVLYGEIYNQSTNHEFYKYRDLIEGKFKWNGVEITSDRIDCGELDVHRVYKSYSKVKLGERGELVAREKTLFVINDINSTRGAKNRLSPVIDKPEYEWTFLFTFVSEEQKTKFITDNHLENLAFRNLSEFPYNKGARDGNGVYNPRHAAKTFILSETNDWSGTRRNNVSGYWTPAEVDLEQGGVYVSLERFKTTLFGREQDGEDLNYLLEKLEKAGVTVDEVYGFRPSYLEQNPLPANWISLDKYAKEKLEPAIQTNSVGQKWADFQEIEKLNGEDRNANAFSELVTRRKIALQPNGVAAEFVKALKKTKKSAEGYNEFRDLAATFNLTVPETTPSFDLVALWKKVSEKYSMITLITSSYFQSYYDNENQPLIQYIEELDKI